MGLRGNQRQRFRVVDAKNRTSHSNPTSSGVDVDTEQVAPQSRSTLTPPFTSHLHVAHCVQFGDNHPYCIVCVCRLCRCDWNLVQVDCHAPITATAGACGMFLDKHEHLHSVRRSQLSQSSIRQPSNNRHSAGFNQDFDSRTPANELLDMHRTIRVHFT